MSSGWKTFIIILTAVIIIGVYESSHGDKRGEFMSIFVICGAEYLLINEPDKKE